MIFQWIPPCPLSDALQAACARTGLQFGPSDMKLTAREGGMLTLRRENDTVHVTYDCPAALARAMGLLLRAFSEDGDRLAAPIKEKAAFKHLGLMADASRGAVPTVDTVKYLLEKLALMGYDRLMLYTEDTYPVPEEEWFGYMRGAYTESDLKALDAYAGALGIEMIPCVQTLAHLDRFLKWPDPRKKYWDALDVLLTDDENTYSLIDRMFASLRRCYTTRRLHIGMDEAQGLGLGRHLQRHGYQSHEEIMSRHLKRVCALAEKHGFEPMMWSDMFFRMASENGGYYNVTAIPDSVRRAIPRGLQLMYWDYYHDDPAFYERMLKLHGEMADSVSFAGGAWNWLSPVCDTDLMLARSLPALDACRKAHTDDVWLTLWGDDGGECGILSSMYAMQVYAEGCRAGAYDENETKARFAAVTGQAAEPLVRQARFHRPDGTWALSDVNCCKFLLYQDPLLGLYEKDIEGLPLESAFTALAQEYRLYEQDAAPMFDKQLSFLARLAETLAFKAEVGASIRRAYRAGNRAALEYLAKKRIPDTIEAARRLREAWRDSWMGQNHPCGFELHDVRMGALEARLKSAAARIGAYLAGDVGRIEELEYNPKPLLSQDGRLRSVGFWRDIALTGAPSPSAPVIP